MMASQKLEGEEMRWEQKRVRVNVWADRNLSGQACQGEGKLQGWRVTEITTDFWRNGSWDYTFQFKKSWVVAQGELEIKTVNKMEMGLM